MSNEDRDLPFIITFWQKIYRALFEPNPGIPEIGARREARLMSILNLLFAFFSIGGAVSVFNVVGLSRNVFVLIGLTVISFGAYALARSRLHKVGSYMIVWALAAAAFSVGDADRLINSLNTNLILAFLVASITFPFRYMVFFVILNNIIICLLPYVYPEFHELGIILGEFVPFSLLTLTVVWHRDNVERERFKEVRAFNQELSTLKIELEQRVEERTTLLEERARQLQVVAEVARTAASFQDLDRLLNSCTRLISESFGYYHVGIFLLDTEGQFAVLQAANSEGGQRMLASMHKLPVDLNSIVGYTAKTQFPRIALNTEADSVHFHNPELSETQSEMAVPLKVGMHLIGILDVQSTEKNAFTEEDIAILSTLGDQLAVAIDNTRLLTETRRALASAENTYQRYFRQTWSQFARRLNFEGYRYQDGKVVPIIEKSNDNPAEENFKPKISLPLMVRGQSIGMLDIRPTSEGREWTSDEIALLEVAAERAALALENARLLEDAQRRAARERTIGEMANRISSITSIDSILRSTVEELGQKIGGTEVTFELSTISREMQ